MLWLIPPLGRRLEFAAIPAIAFAFWTLLVLVQISLRGGWIVGSLVSEVVLLCCLLVLSFVSVRRWPALGWPGALILATMATYLVIGVAVSLAADAELSRLDVLRQGFHLVVTLAAIFGGRTLLERIGVEALLKWVLVALTAGCVVILASPLLWHIGVLPEYRLNRFTGAFSNPNDASFVACLTVALALSRWRSPTGALPLALSLVLGVAAVFSTVSNMAVIVLGAILVLFLLLDVRRLRQDLWRAGLTALGLTGVLAYLLINLQIVDLIQQIGRQSPEPRPAANIGVAGVISKESVMRVSGVIVVHLVHDTSHRADDDPVQPWRWQRADAQPSDADTPADAWTDIAGAGSFRYIPTADDLGKFLRAYVYYEKDGLEYMAQTAAIGPIRPAAVPVGVALAFRGVAKDSSGGLSNRALLWKTGIGKIRESPIVGNGLYQLHSIDGLPLTHLDQPAGVHNTYLMLWGEAGVIPLALYLLTLFLLLRVFWTMPKSPARDVIVVWAVVMALYSISSHHLLTMGAYNFFIGLACALTAFLTQSERIGPDSGYDTST